MNSPTDNYLRSKAGQYLLFVVGLLFISAYLLGAFDRLDDNLQEKIASFQTDVLSSNIIIVEIDSKSIEELDTWPWKRSLYALAIEKVTLSGASSIFIDVDFSSRSAAEEDANLAEAISKYGQSIPIRLPTFVQYSSLYNSSLSLSRPLPEFATAAELVSVNILPSDDGFVRRLNSGFMAEGKFYPSAWNSVAASQLPNTYIDFTISPQSFQTLSFADLINNTYTADQFKGKHIFIGATAIELGDILTVPVHKALPGVVLQAIGAETLWRGGIQKISYSTVALLVIGIWALASIVVLTSRWHTGLFLIGVISAGSVLFSYLCYRQFNTLFPSFTLALAPFAAYFAGLIVKVDLATIQNLWLRLSLSNQEILLNKVLATSNDGILQIDNKGLIVNANDNCINIFACTGSRLIGKPIEQLLPELKEEVGSIENRVFETFAIDLQNNVIPVELSISSVSLADDKNHLLALRNIKDRKLKEEALRNAVTYDKLTGLLNRITFFEEADRILSNNEKVCLFKIDIDYFNEINEVYGHDFGDNILKSFTQRLRQSVDEEESILGRVGKDDFTVLREYKDFGEIRKIAEDLILYLSKPIDQGDEALEVFCHVGIAATNSKGDNIENLMRLSNIALSNAKSKGLDYDIISDEKTTDEPRHLAIISAIKTSLKKRDFVLAFQPKIKLSSEEIMGCEVLLRIPEYWSSELSVGKLIEVAESTRLIADLTLQVVDKVLDVEQEWKQNKLPRDIAINLSLGLLANDHFMSRLVHRLDSSLGFFRFEFEITETARSENWEQTLSNLDKLIKRDISLAIDDFGTGYSSLSYLRDLRARVLKIDRSFITDINANLENQSIVNSTIKMAHELNMVVVAEGVETEQEKEFLVKTNCDIVQGYYYAKPMFFEQFSTWVQSHQSDNIVIMPQKS